MPATVSERQDLADCFHSLTPDAQAAALVYGVVDPHVCSAPQVVRMLDHTLDHGDIGSRGRRFSNARLRDANRELVERGLVFAPRRGTGLRASPHWAPWLTMEAHRRGRLDRIVAGHGHVHPGHAYYYDEARTAMELRCHTVAGRFSHIHGDRIGPEGWEFLAEPGAPGLLRTLPEAWRDRALTGCLMHVIHAAASPEPIVEACRDLGSDPSAFAADIAFIRVLQGRLDEVDAVFDALPPGLREGKRARTGHAGARALVATLRGDDDEARRLIEAAVAEERAGTRKRNVFPASPGFALSLLSLVRDDSPSNRMLLAQLLRTAEQRNAEPPVMHYVARACDMRKGTRIAAMMFPAPELGTMLQGLECCWVGQFGQYAEPTPCQALVGYTNRVRIHGFAWALAECLAVIGQPGLQMSEGRPRPAAAYREEADALHARLGTRSLTSLLAPMAEWEYPLKALEELAFETRSKPATAKKRGSSTRRRRLAWELGEDLGAVVAKPREQHQYKNGTWSAGRPVSLKRLATSAAGSIPPRAGPRRGGEDQAAPRWISCFRAGPRRGGEDQTDPRLERPAALPPRRVGAVRACRPPLRLRRSRWGPGPGSSPAPMEVVRGEPELVVDEHEGGLRARLVPDGADSEDYHVQLRGRPPLRGHAVHARPPAAAGDHATAALPEGGLELPAAARVEPAAGRGFRPCLGGPHPRGHRGRCRHGASGRGGPRRTRVLQNDAGPLSAIDWHSAGSSPRGRPARLAAELVVEPVPGSGTWLRARRGRGNGVRRPSREGETVQARRDLPARLQPAPRAGRRGAGDAGEILELLRQPLA